MTLSFSKAELEEAGRTLSYIRHIILKGKLKTENMPNRRLLKTPISSSEMMDALLTVGELLLKLKEDFT